jgi:hypothetical protein
MVRGHAQLTPSHDRGQTVTWRAALKSAALTVEAGDMLETPTMPVTVSAALVSADFIFLGTLARTRGVDTAGGLCIGFSVQGLGFRV